jgi:hypothetical protein
VCDGERREIKRGGEERNFRAERGGVFVWLGQGNETVVCGPRFQKLYFLPTRFCQTENNDRVNMNERLTHATRVRVQHGYVRACMCTCVRCICMYITNQYEEKERGRERKGRIIVCASCGESYEFGICPKRFTDAEVEKN